MAVYTMANATLYIGTTASATDITTYEADTYEAIGEVESVSALVDLQNYTSFTALNNARARQLKTTKSGETITATCGFDPDDAGQVALRDAANDSSQDQYNFKLVYNDTGGANPTSVYWSGKVGNDPYPGGGVEDVSMVEYQITNDTGFTVELRA